MGGIPLIIIVGGDALALRVCAELCGTQGHRVTVLWMHDPAIAAKVEAAGAMYVAASPNDDEALRAAGVMHAESIMVLSDDDGLNVQVALRARDSNPAIRVVMRQFNRALGRKIEQNLPDCSVLSLSAHAAATYAAAALDPSCFYALQFPASDGELLGFAKRRARAFGVDGLTVDMAEQRLGCRVVGVDGSDTFAADRVLDGEELVVFGRVAALAATTPAHHAAGRERRGHAPRGVTRSLRRTWRRIDPIVKLIAGGALLLYVFAVTYFTFALHRDILTAAYFVNATMTTVGYGDITPLAAGPVALVAASAVMFGGVALTGIFIALVTSALTRAQWVRVQGLRLIRTSGHIVVCGCGQVGTRVIELLDGCGMPIVVIERNPDAALIEAARAREVDLLTGDATNDVTLDLCSLKDARALIALTDSDTGNLEMCLGARARNPDLPVVMRVQDDAFARSIARQFGMTTTFSTSALAAPAFAGLSRFPGSHGRIAFAADEYNISDRQQGEVPQAPPAQDCIALGVWRDGRFHQIDRFEQMEPFDRLLFLVPLAQFRTSNGTARDTIPTEIVAP